jgi:hypothetical protein
LYLDGSIDGDRKRWIVGTSRSLKVGFEWFDKGRHCRDGIRMGEPTTREEEFAIVKHRCSQLPGRPRVQEVFDPNLRIVNVHVTASRKQLQERERERFAIKRLLFLVVQVCLVLVNACKLIFDVAMLVTSLLFNFPHAA